MSLLCKLRADPPERTTRTAVVVSEQALARYNRGDPLSAECPGTAGIRPRQLGASYPSETGVLDHPFVRFDWPDLADRQVEAAARFGAWLGTVQGRRALREVGLRDRAFNQGGALSVDYGVLPGAEYHPVAVTADLRGRIRTAYRAAQRTGRVLLALDASGSLGLPADGNRRRWDVAVDGVLTALQRMGSRDEVGLWIFQGENAAGVHELVPIGPRDTPVGGKARGQAVADQLAGVQMGGRTPLYAAIIAGVAAVGPTTEDRATAVVVLTDGEDDNASRLTAQQFRDAVQGRGVQVSVIAIGDAQCSARALSSLTASTGGTCGEAGRSSAAPALATVLTSLWSG
jgi:Mg-chelatase subunit ChlD